MSLAVLCLLQGPSLDRNQVSEQVDVVKPPVKATLESMIKQCKCMVILRDFPSDSALFWLVIY